MAQNITIMGASYSDVPAVQLPKTGGGTARFDDASITTAAAADVASGKVFLAADGTITTGTSSGGGGSSSWTKVAETSYQVSTTGTAAATVATLETGHPEIFTSDKWLYIRVRDTAGVRIGYNYGSDQFFVKTPIITGTSHNVVCRFTLYPNSSGVIQSNQQTGTSGYGVFADTVYRDGGVRIRRRYSSTYGTVDGTYKVEVYLLDPPTGAPIFE